MGIRTLSIIHHLDMGHLPLRTCNMPLTTTFTTTTTISAAAAATTTLPYPPTHRVTYPLPLPYPPYPPTHRVTYPLSLPYPPYPPTHRVTYPLPLPLCESEPRSIN